MSNESRPVVIAGNWKMFKNRKEARELAQAIVNGIKGKSGLPQIVLCPPFTSLETVVSVTDGQPIKVGAQNMDYRESGAFTGEVSPLMLIELGITHVLIGHSERRMHFGETNASVNLKLKAALKHKLVPIVCVGESLDEQEANLTDAVVSRQVAAALDGVLEAELDSLMFAYEPVWAIGTGKVCQPDQANRVSKLIRSTIANFYSNKAVGGSVAILYGGSVKASNIDAQLAESDIDGALVGGASLQAEEFLSLIDAGARRLKSVASRS